jgi:hypothetical protein
VARKYSVAQQLRNQLEIEATPGQDIFSEEPVPLDVFLNDNKYMGQPPLGEHQFNLVRHMEQIYLPSMYPFLVENFGEYWTPVRFVNYLNVQWGKGSGKDHSVRMAVARIAYLLSCLKSPQEYFGFARQDEIHILNVAMNAAQARRAFFKPLGTLLKNTAWFSDKLRSEITDMATSIRLDKQIELISGHSQAENFEGLNTIAVVLDEISGFQSEDQKAARGIVESQRTAEAVYDIVRTSASTRFPENFKVAAISYPRYLNDPIQNLCAKGNADIEKNGLAKSNYFVDGPRTTWDVNPRYAKFERVAVEGSKTLIPNVPSWLADYENDPMMARAKYECLPERSSNRYFRNDAAINGSLPKQAPEWVDPVQINYYWGLDVEGAKAEGSYELATVPGWQTNYTFSPDLKPYEGAVYTLHADLAISGDRAGIAMCHVKNWERREHKMGDPLNMKTDYQVDDRPVIKVDFVTSYESDLTATDPEGEPRARDIQIRWFRNLIRELKRRGFVIGFVTFDNFQSADSIQILESWGIEADKLSMDRNKIPYATLREVMYDGRLEGYYRERVIEELEGLTELPSGKIDHPPGGSKDETDALCGAVMGALTMGGDEGETPEEIDTNGPGIGYEVYGAMGGADDFWGNADFGITREEFNFVTGSW